MGRKKLRQRERAERSVATIPPPSLIHSGEFWRYALALALVVFVAYLPSLGGGVLWDDSAHMTKPELRSVAGLMRIWFEPGAAQQYYPLMHTTFWIDQRLFGQSTLAPHLITLALHIGAALLLWRLLVSLAVPGAFLIAAVFALHPIEVESVAWIFERKNTLSAVFYLSALIWYLRFDRTRRRREYLIAVSLFVGGLLSKTVVATLPGAILVILWWKNGRLDLRRDVLPVLPLFVLGLMASAVTSWSEFRGIGNLAGSDWDHSLAERVLQAGRAT